jgi:two-component system chemotaxis sensor kinase CheA
MPNKAKSLRNFSISRKYTLSTDVLKNDENLRISFLNIMFPVASLFLIVFGISVYAIEGDYLRAFADFTEAMVCLICFLLLRTKLPSITYGTAAIIGFGVLCSYFVFTGAIRGYESLWIFSFPMLAIIITGISVGLILSILLLCTILVATMIPGLAGISYTILMSSRMAGAYVLVTALTVIYEQIRLMKDREITRLTQELQVESDEIIALKDSLKTGIFLMDKNLVIQPSYSKALESILGTGEIQGKKITDFLGSSLKARELEVLEKFFNMVISGSYKEKMLEDINPISEFVYIRNEREKNLRTGFTAVDRGYGIFMIQGTLEDISAQVLLQKELKAEEAKRDEEMRFLFQIIKIDPNIFSDFIKDTEYEFNRANDVLKKQDISYSDALGAIYQSVHAIKSNALILDLDNFSTSLHELESKIKTIRDKENISFDDILDITMDLNSIMNEKDKYQKTIEQIGNLKSRDNGLQNSYVLIETLTRACEKTGLTEGKKVKFTADDIDELVLESGPRRTIKEILTQLVRNAVIHGIEDPEQRKNLGKETDGRLRLSIKPAGNQIHIKFSDDGGGIDFDKIRKKAESLKLYKPKSGTSDQNALLQLIFHPGFSTANEVNMSAGRGVGLDLVKNRIRELRGSIKVSTNKGKGTVFDLFIPLDIADSAAS